MQSVVARDQAALHALYDRAHRPVYTLGTIKTRIRSGLHKLRQELAAGGYGR